MEFTLKVVHTADASLLEALKALAGNKTEVSTSDNGQAETKPKAKKEKPEPAPSSEVKIEELRALVQQKAKGEGKRPAVKDLLQEFGAEGLSELAPEKYADFKVKVQAL